MKKAFSILMLLVAMLMAWPARAQQTLTVANGTTTNSYVPVYGFYTDAYLRAQILYPSDSLVNVTGGLINGLTFYASNSSVSWGAASFEVKLGETTATSLSAWNTATLTTVYTGSLSISGNQMTVTFATPYVYTGGNLLIEVNNVVKGSYVSSSWYGVTLSGASVQGYNSSSWSSISATARNFLPKTTFNYIPASGCAFPINLAISGVDSTQATVTWGDTSSASAWRVYWYPTDSLSLMDSADVTDSTYTFYGLNSNTAYTVKVMTLCTEENSPLMTTSFRTDCGVTAIPYTTSFEDVDASMNPFCWTQVTTGGFNGFPKAYAFASNARTGTNYLEFETTTGGGTQIMALPVVDNISGLRLNFYAACTNHNFVLEAGVMEDTVFVPVDTIPLTTAADFNSSAYNHYSVYYSNYFGMGYKMALRVTGTAAYTLFIDDVTIDEIPPCPDPTYFTLDSVGTDWAALSWVDNGSISSWVLEYDTVPFTPGAGTASFVEYPVDVNITLTGLDTGFTYYAYVHGDCGSDTTQNLYLVFNTLAGDPATVPYSCGFEGSNSNGWEFANGSQTNYWMVGSATNNGGNQSLYVTNNGSSNAYTTSSTSHTYAYRVFNLSDTGEYAYSYDWKCQGESHYYDFTRVFLTPNSEEFVAGSVLGGSTYNFSSASCPQTWIELTAQTGATPNTMSQSSSWQTAFGTFRITTPGTYKMVFVWSNDVSGGSQPPTAIDNVTMTHSTCSGVQNLAATHVTSDSIIVAWQPGGSEMTWIVSNGIDTIEVYDTTYTFDNLFANTLYNISVWAICDYTDTSIVSAIGVRTACGAMALPYSEDFNSYAQNSWPSCWTRIINSSNYPYITTSYGNCIQFGGNAYAISPRLSVPLNQVIVSFDLQVESTSSSGAMHFGYTTDPVDATNMVDLQVFTPTSTYTYYHYEFDLSNDTCTDTVYLVWRPDGSTAWYYWLDNLVIDRASTCPAVEGLRTSAVSNNFATIAWTDTAAASHLDYMVYIATIDNIAAAFDSVSVTSGTTSYTFTGLTGNTHYYVWVKGVCYDEDSRFRSLDFTTSVDCAPVTNVHATPDYYAFNLTWDGPTAGETATEYIVEFKPATATAWTADSTTNTYYYVSGLNVNTLYDYRVRTKCTDVYSTNATGSVQTSGCSRLITDGGTTNSYLPTYIYYGYSYTQQIYLNDELTGLDTITDIAFNTTGTVSGRPIVIYMGNTTQSSFSSTSNYIPLANLQQVGTGTLNGTGWISFHLTTPFVRTAGSNLVVAIDDNTGSYVSSIPWAATATSTARALYFYQDGTNIDPASPSASSSNVINYVNQIKLTNATCVIPTCGTPTPSVSDIQANQATINWYAEAGQVYTVEYRLATDTAWTIADAANTTGTCIITNLVPALDYVVRVSTPCSDLTLSGTVNFSTLCAPATLPYTEDFENYSGTYDRTCWTIGSTNLGTNYPNPTVVNLTGDPNKLCLFYNGAYAIMPRMDAPLNQLQIRFYFVQGGDNVRFLMGLMDDPTAPISTMRVLDTIIRSQIDSTTAYVNYTYRFDQLTDADSAAHIAFWDAFNDNYSFLDNIVVEYIPNCQSVTGLTASNVTTTSADISWTDNNTSVTGYVVEYGVHGFTPGTGSTANATITPYTLNGLMSSTLYDVYVYTVCGNDTSIASQVLTFATECAAITTLPYTMNFEGYVSAGSTATNILPTCWNTENTGAYIYYNTNLSQAPSQSYALQLMGNGIVVLPEMGVQLDSLMVSFHDYNVSGYGLIVGAIEDTVTSSYATNFVPIDTVLFENGVNASMVASYLTDYTGTATRIALKAYGNNGTGVSHYIDNLTIDRIPSCIAPQRVQCATLTNVSADITWRTSQAPSYSVEYGLHGFTPGTGTSQTVTTRSISLTGLTPLTQYDVRLVSLCSATEMSDTTVFTFTTLRAAPVMTYPYFCDFADSATAAAWEPVNGSQTNQWYLGSAAHYGTADNMAYYVTNDNGTSNSYSGSASHTYVYRTFNMPAGSYNVSFKWQANGEGGSTYAYDYLRAFLAPADATIQAGSCPDGTTSSYSFWNVTPAGWISLDGSQPLRGASSWQTQSEDVTIPTTGTYNLVFYWGNDGSVFNNPAGAIDNIEISRNVCRVVNLVQDPAVPVGSSQIAVRWDTNGASIYELEYGPVGFAHGTGTLITTTGNTAVATGLNGLTPYEFCVRGICNGTDTGAWTCATFQTEMCDNATIVESWDSTMTTTTSGYAPIGYSLYNYSYVQTIIDSARFAELTGDITAFAFKPENTTSSDYYTNMTIYMANVADTDLAADFIHPDSAHQFVRVMNNGSLNFTDVSWQLHSFDTAFTWDGHSNVLFAVLRGNGDWSSAGSFAAHSTSATKTRYVYQDDGPYDYTTVSGGTGAQYIGDLKFYSCGAAGCARPTITSVTGDYQSATMNWSGNGTAYEVAIKAVSDANWPAETSVSGNSYTFTGLQPATPYMLRVRQDCTADSLGYSAWATTTFVTDSLPCLAPESLAVSNLSNAMGTFAWTPSGNETAWDLHVWNAAGYDSIYTVATNPATVGGFTAGVTYNAAIRALCGDAANIEGEWGDTIQFTTAICPQTTGVTTSDVTFSSVTVSWTAVSGAQGYLVAKSYGTYSDTITTTNTTYTFNGLESEMTYTFRVLTVCAADWLAENWSTPVSATTLEEPADVYTLTVTVNDPNMGYVTINGSEANTYRGVEGDVVTLAAVPFEGYAFDGWSDGNTEATRSYTLTQPEATLTATFRQSVGIDAVVETATCTLIPNPAKGVTTVTVTGISGKVRIAVLDLSGREVLGREFSILNAQCSIPLDIEGLAEGAYFVRVTSETNVPMVKKLIVR